MANITITIRRDGAIPSRPWCADIEMNGNKFVSWMAHFRSKTRMMQEIDAVLGRRKAVFVDAY